MRTRTRFTRDITTRNPLSPSRQDIQPNPLVKTLSADFLQIVSRSTQTVTHYVTLPSDSPTLIPSAFKMLFHEKRGDEPYKGMEQ
jgi:hypothetical protein